jgi:hypothetical protein
MTDESAANEVSDPDSDPDPNSDDRFDPDPGRVALLRKVADDVRGESSESRQIAAILYRVSDLYDAGEETSPEEIYRNVTTVLEISERGTLER